MKIIISYLGFGGLCVYENIPVNVPNGLDKYKQIKHYDLVKSYNFKNSTS